MDWEAAYGKSYEIQTSNDAVSWTTIYSTTSGAKKNYSNIEEGVNFASKPEKHMANPARQVPVQILIETIKSVKGLADPNKSDALYHYV